MAAYKDYYKILEVPRTASQKEIRAAFRKLAAKYHPDRNKGDEQAEERFKEVNEAYTVLNDAEKRKVYDRYGSQGGQQPFAPGAGGRVYTNVNPEDVAGFSDFFQTLFGGGAGFSGGFRSGFSERDSFGGFGEAPRPARRSTEAELTIALQLAYRGGDTTITIDGRQIEFTIPAGTRERARLRLRGQAPDGGDLILRMKLSPDPTFKLDGDNVRVKVPVPDYRAVLGGPVRVPTLDGDVEMNLPAGTRAGRVLRLRGKGWPKADGDRGDEFAEITIDIPDSPTAEQIEHYRELAALADEKESAGAAA
ncbi:MAG: DnaJ C-terminal domain-containing protein [Trueperaceae bacterium]